VRRSLEKSTRGDTPELPRPEWDFSECPGAEVFEWHAYEFAREIPAILADVARMRKRMVIAPTFEELEKTLRNQIDRSARVTALFWYCPEFPNKSYLSISPSERQRRLHVLWRSVGSRSISIKAKIVPPDFSQRLNRGRVFYGKSLELAALEFNWRHSNEFLEQAFAAWLKENRPPQIEPDETRGAGNWQRQLANELKTLAAKRLLGKMNWQDAFTLTGHERTCPVDEGQRKKRIDGLYCDREEVWRKAAEKAKSVIQSFTKAYTAKKID